jgi:hypothetical protein
MLDVKASRADRLRCTCRPSRDQLRLFDGYELFVELHARSYCGEAAVTGGSGKIGFWHDETADVFLGRCGDGPLIICPDTDVLIWIVDAIERIEEKIGLVTAPLLGGNWNDPVEAITDLLHLWQFRDIRFFISEHYLRDGQLTPARRSVRERVVDELSFDMAMRGGFALVSEAAGNSDEVEVLSRTCPAHPWMQHHMLASSPARWPHAKDRPLLADALATGCHVFLTCDKGVLACATEFARCGLAIMTPGDLLQRLDRDNQLDAVPEWPIDLDVIGRFYGIALAVEEAGPISAAPSCSKC